MKKVIIAAVIIAAVALAGLSLWYLSGPPEELPSRSDSIIVAYSPFESTALFWIAEDQGYFDQNGLDLIIRKYDSGAASLDGLVKGEADITVGVTEFPLVGKAFENARVRAIANIDKGDFIYIIARKDRGIENASDLKGKRVGTTRGTVAEFHLGRFLALHGMGMQDITVVDVRTPEGWVNAVADGEVDAISTAQPYANGARDRLGDNAVFWPAQSKQPLFALVISTEEWIARHPRPAERFLRALSQAEDYTVMHPEEARDIVQKSLDLDPSYMDTVWRQNQFSLTLDQSLITAMEDEARWMISNNLTNATEVPDFREYISTDSLEAVKPGSVNIIR